MNTNLPIIIKPSRLAWGFWMLLWAGIFVALAAEWDGDWVDYTALPIFGLLALRAGYNCIFLPPRMIIDESGVGGRFEGGDFVGARRVAWEDITGARFLVVSVWTPTKDWISGRSEKDMIVLDVNNPDGKYRPERKLAHLWRSLIVAWETAGSGQESSVFAFDVSKSNLSRKEAKEIVEVINRLAKGTPLGAFGQSPFAKGAMDDRLPVVVMPSRWKWAGGFLFALALLPAMLYVFVNYVPFSFGSFGPEELASFLKDAPSSPWFIFAACFVMFFMARGVLRNFIFIKPRIVIKEDGVGGCFNGKYNDTRKIPWDDIIGARIKQGTRKLILQLDNTGDKYWNSSEVSEDNELYMFYMDGLKLNGEQEKQVVAIINHLAKANPPKSTNSPSAAE